MEKPVEQTRIEVKDEMRKETELSVNTEMTLSAFNDYVVDNQEKISGALQANKDLYKLFYREFYATDARYLKYQRDDPRFQNLAESYDEAIERIEESLYEQVDAAEEKDGKSDIDAVETSGWIQWAINEGVPRQNGEMERFYLNVSPEVLPDFYREMLDELRASGVHTEMKIPVRGRASEFNRYDKLVIYFVADEEIKLLQAIEKLYRKDHSVFDDGIPRFAGRINDTDGQVMKGVGFGQEPTLKQSGEESFGSIRARVLDEMYRAIYLPGSFKTDQTTAFKNACMRWN